MSKRVTYRDNSKALTDDLKAAIRKAMKDTAVALHAEATIQCQTMIYDTPESPTYQRTFNLIQSISHYSTSDTAVVAAETPYAFFVHEGTRYMTPRPFLDAALQKQSKEIAKRIGRAFE